MHDGVLRSIFYPPIRTRFFNIRGNMARITALCKWNFLIYTMDSHATNTYRAWYGNWLNS